MRFVSWNLNGNLLNKISVLETLLLRNDLMCVQKNFLVFRKKHPILSLLDISIGSSVPVKRVHSQCPPSGDLANLVSASIRST